MASGPPFPQPPPPSDPSSSGSDRYDQSPGEYRWLAPAALPSDGSLLPGFSPAARAPMYELRPLSTGEVLDRTFSLYRSRFLLFAGIASVSAAVQLIGQAVQLVVQHVMLHGRSLLDVPQIKGFQLTSNLLGIAVSAVFLLAFAITQAATMWAMGEVYMGRGATVTGSLSATASRWLRYLGIAFWQMGSMVWLPAVTGAAFAGIWLLNGRSFGGFGIPFLMVLLLIAAFVAGFIFYLRNLLAVPITVREGLGVRASMRRSKVLTPGAKGKLFLVLLMAAALYMVMAILMGIVAALTMVLPHHGGNILDRLLPAQIAGLGLGFVGYAVITPVIMIGIALVYFDQRVRKEAFDVAVLMGEESGSLFAAPAPASTIADTVAEYPVAEAPRSEAVGSGASAAEPPIIKPPVVEPPITDRIDPPVNEPQGGASGL